MCACLTLLVCMACSVNCVFVCFYPWLRQLVTGFNERTFRTSGVCVSWDLLVLTEGLKGELTFVFHPGSRWTANQVFIFLLSLLSRYNDVAQGSD